MFRRFRNANTYGIQSLAMALLCFAAQDALATSVTVGGVPFLLPAAGGPFLGVDAATGYGFAGTVATNAGCAGGGIVGALGAKVCLTDLVVNNPAAAGGGALLFSFAALFDRGAGAGAGVAVAQDQAEGSFSDAAAGAVNSSLLFGGFINGAPIVPPPGNYAVVAVGASPIPFPPPFPNTHGPMLAAVGRFFSLSGNVEVTLGAGDILSLPDSAVVGADVSATPSEVPEPAAVPLVAGALLLLIAWRRRASPYH